MHASTEQKKKTSKYVPLTFEWAYNTGIWVASDNKIYNSMSNTVHIIFLGLELISLHTLHIITVRRMVFIPLITTNENVLLHWVSTRLPLLFIYRHTSVLSISILWIVVLRTVPSKAPVEKLLYHQKQSVACAKDILQTAIRAVIRISSSWLKHRQIDCTSLQRETAAD